jgi:hypothetical protein
MEIWTRFSPAETVANVENRRQRRIVIGFIGPVEIPDWAPGEKHRNSQSTGRVCLSKTESYLHAQGSQKQEAAAIAISESP